MAIDIKLHKHTWAHPNGEETMVWKQKGQTWHGRTHLYTKKNSTKCFYFKNKAYGEHLYK